MKTTIALIGLLISCHLAAADIYEFTFEPAQPAPAKTAPKATPKPAPKPTAAAVKPPATPAPQPASTSEQADAVVQMPTCALGASCNDL